MQYPKKIKCPNCKKIRIVDYRIVWQINKKQITARCLNCSRFKKGQTNSGGFKKGHIPSNKGIFIKTKNYSSIHKWLVKLFGSANRCENKNCKKLSKNYDWAKLPNKSYARIRKNFNMLCKSCHQKQDRQLTKQHERTTTTRSISGHGRNDRRDPCRSA